MVFEKCDFPSSWEALLEKGSRIPGFSESWEGYKLLSPVRTEVLLGSGRSSLAGG